MEAKDLRALRISMASPEQIRSWSYGEVTKPETINYRRLRPEKDGLFCEAIFGPTKDWQCYCGKYKNVRYRGIICDKCGVEVTRSSVRRERMGHIELAAPVAHVWYTRRVPSYMGLLLNINQRNLDRVLYFAQYVITHVDEEARQKALKRLEEDAARREKEMISQVEEQISLIQMERDEKIEAHRAKIDEISRRYEEELTARTDEVIGEAQNLQSRIENLTGSPAPETIRFEPANAIIAEKGEVITTAHLGAIQEAVTSLLNEIQAQVEARKRKEVAREEAQIALLMSEAIGRIEKLRAELTNRLGRLKAKVQESRRELKELAQLQFLDEARYRDLKSKYGQVFRAGMGAEAFYEILKSLDLDKLSEELWHEVRTTRSKQRRKKATRRLKVVESFRKSGNRPEWMILIALPVIPPDLRPMVQLDGGRFATSDLNDLYRRVINRNNRLKRLLELGAPDVIVRNEKRMLQEAVDSLIDNSQRGKALSRRGRRELKSLSDMLKGKKGRFRRNLLGKRVDYSGRSVIVIGPKLKLHQCGLPKTMALELYRPFVISKLVKYNYAPNVKGAKRLIERERPEVWEVLEEVVKERPVLLNRAPTLHRLGIQAFEPILVEGKAIQIHPLVCAAFNADFDGDQMAVHIPLSEKAVWESRELMLSTKNLLKPADGMPIVGPSKDMVLGNYYLTMDPNADIVTLAERADEFPTWSSLKGHRIGVPEHTPGHFIGEEMKDDFSEFIVYEDIWDAEGKTIIKPGIDLAIEALLRGEVDAVLYNANDAFDYFEKHPNLNLTVSNLNDRHLYADIDEVKLAHDLGVLSLHDPIRIANVYQNRPPDPEPVVTTVGRAIFNSVLPDELRFVHGTQTKNSLRDLVALCYQKLGPEVTTEVVDRIKNIGFKYATLSGTTIAVSDLVVPEEREAILEDAAVEMEHIDSEFKRGLLTPEERYRRTIDLWNRAKIRVGEAIKRALDPFGPIAIMALSGSTKGGFGPITQLAGMRGLMADPAGRIIDLPIRSHFRMGLSTLEYFISTHGSRKGLADTALRTADAGYLTRRLIDVAQDIIINEWDCGTEAGIWIRKKDDVAKQTLQERILGRCLAAPVVNPKTGEVMAERNQLIDDDLAKAIQDAGVEEVYVRSPLTCELEHGICALCYGRDLGRGEMVELGAAVGIVAAQSIGEPGTQLTLRTFHTGGIAEQKGDITSGLPRVEELLEARKTPKGEAVMSEIDGYIFLRREGERRIAEVRDTHIERKEYDVPEGWDILVESGDVVMEGDVLAAPTDGEEGQLIAEMEGEVFVEDRKIYIRREHQEVREYEIPSSANLMPEIYEGARVRAGQQITEGSKNPHTILRVLGAEATYLYILSEVQKVYRHQGVNIADKHFEVILRKMLSKVQIVDSGDTDLLPGDLIDKLKYRKINEQIVQEGGNPAKAVPVLLGVTKAALSTESFLAASSFQHTIRVLSKAAIEGKEDKLYGLKENVIIGKLIPAGTGFHAYRKALEEEKARREAAQKAEEAQEAPEGAGMSLKDNPFLNPTGPTGGSDR